MSTATVGAQYNASRHRRRRAGAQPPHAGARCAWRRRNRADPRSDRVLSGKEGRSRLRGRLREGLHRRFRQIHGRRLRRRGRDRHGVALYRGRRARSAGRQRGDRIAGHRSRHVIVNHPQSAGAADRRQRAGHVQYGPRAIRRPGDAENPRGHAGPLARARRRRRRRGQGSARARHSRDRGLQPVAWRPRQRPADRQFRRHCRVLNHVPQGAYDRRRRRRGVFERHRPASSCARACRPR